MPSAVIRAVGVWASLNENLHNAFPNAVRDSMAGVALVSVGGGGSTEGQQSRRLKSPTWGVRVNGLAPRALPVRRPSHSLC